MLCRIPTWVVRALGRLTIQVLMKIKTQLKFNLTLLPLCPDVYTLVVSLFPVCEFVPRS